MKNYDAWNKKKKSLEERTVVPEFNEREIWWCNLGVNLGYEADGKHDDFERPVCIVRKFNKDTFLGYPLSSVMKEGRYYFPLTLLETASTINLSQGRLFSAKRLQRRLGRMDTADFERLKNLLRSLLF